MHAEPGSARAVAPHQVTARAMPVGCRTQALGKSVQKACKSLPGFHASSCRGPKILSAAANRRAMQGAQSAGFDPAEARSAI